MKERCFTPQDLNPPAIVQEVKMTWEQWHVAFEDLREEDDSTQIKCGKMARNLKKQHGKAGVLKMAIEVNIAKSTMAERMKVVEVFDDDALAEYSILSFSHLRLCARQKDPHEWAIKCMDNNWTVENLVMELKKLKPEKTINIEEAKGKIVKVIKDVKKQGSDSLNQLMEHVRKIVDAWEKRSENK